MKKIIILLLILSFTPSIFSQEYKLESPNNKIKVELEVSHKISWKLFYNNELIIDKGNIAIQIDDHILPGKAAKIINESTQSINEEIISEVPVKFKKIQTEYHQLILDFDKAYSVEFRLYNDGFAYRFITAMEQDIKVNHETIDFSFTEGAQVFFPEETSLISHYERCYQDTLLSGIESGKFASLPILFQSKSLVNIHFTEADLYDYPCLFIEKDHKLSLKAKFPNVILDIKANQINPDRNEIILKEAKYIANTIGKRSFPWRVFTITAKDKDLLKSQLVYNLSRKNTQKNFDWVKPGKVAWDWWNAWNITGVDFKSGINTETYKYYIDFASDYGLEYIIMDEGWSKTTTQLLECNPDINMPELMSYAKKKNVRIILWVLWNPLNQNMEEILDQFASWGAAGIKVDFMQRADQEMVNFYLKTAQEAAKRELLVDFHGAFKPAGLRAAYPNVVSYEGLKGLENAKWSALITPKHDLILPFTRMLAGPMDYTPGAMVNAHFDNYTIRWERPMSIGTRTHQLAMYVVFESPLQMLADNPSNYKKEHECTSFISKIPSIWDETIPLDAKIGEYLIIARRNGDKWYVAAMTDKKPREFEIDFSFLPNGNYQMEYIQDGINASKNAEDYKKGEEEINNTSKLKINLASGGGWVAIITPL